MEHGLHRFGPKMRGVVFKIECVQCREKRAGLATVAETDLEDFLKFSRRQLAKRLGPCKAGDGKHKWKTDILHSRSLAGNCMCEACWPSPDAQPV